MSSKSKILFLIFFLLFIQYSYSQTKKNDNDNLIQFSGLLLSADSIYGVPFASVSVKSKPYGTYTGLDGYFSFVAQKGDTVVFSHVEFRKTTLIIPDTLKGNKYTIIKLMVQDTFQLPLVVIRPMPNRASFDHTFVTQNIPNDDLARAKYNLEKEKIKEQIYQMQGSSYEAYKTYVNQQLYNQQFKYGQTPPIGLLNPFAWVQFFEMWSKGKYKSEDPKPQPVSPVSTSDSTNNSTTIP